MRRAAVVVVGLVPWVTTFLGAQQTALVSHAAGDPYRAANEQADVPSASADGRYVALDSRAGDLVAGLTNPSNARYAALWDRETDATTLVSHAAGFTTKVANGNSFTARVSADGAFVAFDSLATDLVAGSSDGNFGGDVYCFDRATGDTILVSHSASSQTSTANGDSNVWAISGDGRYVVFGSRATDVVAGQVDTNQQDDLFLWDRVAGSTILISHAAGTAATTASLGSYEAKLDGSGRWIAFHSAAPDLISGGVIEPTALMTFLYDRETNDIVLVSHAAGQSVTNANGISSVSAISTDGSVVVLRSDASNLSSAEDDNGVADAYLWSRESGEIELVSRAPGLPVIAGNDFSEPSAVSATGRFVAFQSSATDLIAGGLDTNGIYDAFLFDRVTGAVTLLSHAFGSSLDAGDHLATPVAVSADGERVLLTSQASNLTPAGVDTNGTLDAFLWRRSGSRVELLSRAHGGARSGSAATWARAMTGDGEGVLMMSFASDLIAVPQPAGHVYSGVPPLFSDGLETGDLSAWSLAVP